MKNTIENRIEERRIQIHNDTSSLLKKTDFTDSNILYLVEQIYDDCLMIIKEELEKENDNMPTKNDLGNMLGCEWLTMNIQSPRSETIYDFNVIVPGKVVEVIFADGTKEKMVCHKDDTFDLRNCLFIAIAKHLYKEDYTFEGIEWIANQLKYMKKYVKIVDVAMKFHDRRQKLIIKQEEEHKAELERIERKRAKKEAYKKRRAIKKENIEKEKQIEIQKEAYIRAMNEIHNRNNQAV